MGKFLIAFLAFIFISSLPFIALEFVQVAINDFDVNGSAFSAGVCVSILFALTASILIYLKLE